MRKTCFLSGNPHQEFPWDYENEKEILKEYNKELEKIALFLLKKGFNYFVFNDNLSSALDLVEMLFSLKEQFSFEVELCIFNKKVQSKRILSLLQKADAVSDFSKTPLFFRYRKWKNYAVKNADFLFSIWNDKRKNKTYRLLRTFEKANRRSLFFSLNLLLPSHKEVCKKIPLFFGMPDTTLRNEWDS